MVVSDVDETFDPTLAPAAVVEQLALRKARDVATSMSAGSCLVIGADTVVAFRDRILEKPGSADEAFEMLQQLSGNTHEVFTGVALVKTDEGSNITEIQTFVEDTEVEFGTLQEAEIKAYVKTGSPMDKAGSYGIQDSGGALFVKSICGDYNTVVGFPLYSFYQHMKHFAPEVISHTLKEMAS